MINVAIIEDNFQYRTTLSIILQLNENIKLIHKGENCEEIISLFRFEKPDVVLMDIDLPGISGIQGVWEIKKSWPDIKVIMLTVFEDDEKIFGAIKAGANGYLLKKDPPQKILDAIKELYEGKASMNGLIAKKVMEYFHKKKAAPSVDEFNLTRREHEILELLIE